MATRTRKIHRGEDTDHGADDGVGYTVDEDADDDDLEREDGGADDCAG